MKYSYNLPAASNLATYFLPSRNPVITNKNSKMNPGMSHASKPLWVLSEISRFVK
jgi:hypothetical protein